MPACASCGRELADTSAPCPECTVPDSLATQTVAAPRTSRPGRSSSVPATDGSRFVPGELVADRYRIIAPLGRGGMGEVYRADDLTVGQQVALKFLPVALSHNEDALRRFRNEVRVARQVSHPNVCRVYDVGEVDGQFFLSMEYVDGEDLGSLLRRIGRLPADKALEIGRKLCAGLAAAHDKGVLHRDLKPANVMLDGRGQVLLTDFGLAGLAQEITGLEVRSGTPAYMAPEQLSGREVTVRSDIYSLGLVLYEIFTGKRPFEGNTLQEILQQRTNTVPESPASFVRDLDPAVERVILRCLEPEPAKRPPSALSVAAALPGGDPLAAALAAGETPSPQMVAAAGEGTELAPRYAIPIFAVVLAGMLVTGGLAVRTSALERMAPDYPPEVLAQKARDIAGRLGYAARPVDSEFGFWWDPDLAGYINRTDKPSPRWSEVLAGRPSLLRFWYRQSNELMTGVMFHDDVLTPGIVRPDDPPPVQSGMVSIDLDHAGRLIEFQAIPPQKLEPLKEGTALAAADWKPLFDSAGFDAATLQPAEPLWTFLGASDTRVAWTGTWPGTSRPVRVEAASLRGKPVAFSVIGPWTAPSREPETGGSSRRRLSDMVYGIIAAIICVGAAVLARRNLGAGRGDRRGAFKLAAFTFTMHMAVWLFRSHITVSVSLVGLFFLALCTSLFYGLVIWTVYLALEPYARRHWPRTLIAWTRVLTGQIRDPLVGRDALVGAGLGVSWVLIGRIYDLLVRTSSDLPPTWTDAELLRGFRAAMAEWLTRGPRSVLYALLFFFLLFLLRLLLRNQWLGAAAFVVVLTIPQALKVNEIWEQASVSVIVYALMALVVLRFGLLSLAVAFFVSGMIGPPPTLHTSAWYFFNIMVAQIAAVGVAIWAFWLSVGQRGLWRLEA